MPFRCKPLLGIRCCIAVCGNTVELECVFRAGGACVARDRALVQTIENEKGKKVTIMPTLSS